MANALIVGGTGQIGFNVATRLASEGWEVTIASRKQMEHPGPWSHLAIDVARTGALLTAIDKNYDLILSCIAFDAIDADELVKVQSYTGRIIVISSVSVCCDHKGRTLDEARDGGFPDFPDGFSETCNTVPPGPETYSTRKVAMEQALLKNATVPITILRPSAIHGPYSKHAREWWFVKRLLDGRKQIPLAFNGQSRMGTTSVDAISEAVVRATGGELPALVNVRDADCPSVYEIGRIIMSKMQREADLVCLPDDGYPAQYGVTPWSLPKPYICDAIATHDQTYADTVGSTIDWLVRSVNTENWKDKLPHLAGYPYDHFDYNNDDEALALIKTG